jgi:hypothetical protein
MNSDLPLYQYILQFATMFKSLYEDKNDQKVYASISLKQRISGKNYMLQQTKQEFFSNFDQLMKSNEWFANEKTEQQVKLTDGSAHFTIFCTQTSNNLYLIQKFKDNFESRHTGFEIQSVKSFILYKKEELYQGRVHIENRPQMLQFNIIKDTAQNGDMKHLQDSPLSICFKSRPCDRTFDIHVKCKDHSGKETCSHVFHFELLYILNSEADKKEKFPEGKERKTCDVMFVFRNDWMNYVDLHSCKLFTICFYSFLVPLLGKPIQSRGDYQKLKFKFDP